MPLKLHPACMIRLDDILASELPNLRVEHRKYLSYASTGGLAALDKALSTSKDGRKDLADMIDDSPVVDFVVDRIGRKLDVTEEYVPEVEAIPLTELSAFADPAGAAHGIIAELDTLPWDYTFSFEFPAALADEISGALGDLTSVALSDDVSLVKAREALASTYPLPPPPDAQGRLGLMFSNLSHPEWREDGLYLQMRGRGYVDRYGITGTAQDAVTMLQAFIGIGMAQRVFRYEWKLPLGLGPPRVSFHVHIRDDDGWRYDTTIDLESGLAAALTTVAGEAFSTPDVFASMLFYALNKLRICFSHPKKAERIMRSGQWLFGSYTTRNETLAFLQSMVSLEILLGHKDMSKTVGLGALLANRCAYLIGKSQAERDALLDDFGGLYQVRSDIVHSGKSRLTNSERSMLSKLRWICARAIQEEIDLLEKDVRKA